jgi:hypothetical protein
MKKLKMIVTSVVVLAIVGSAFAFNAQKKALFCTSGGTSTTCNTITPLQPQKRIAGTADTYYVVDWDGVACSTAAADTHVCTTSAKFAND